MKPNLLRLAVFILLFHGTFIQAAGIPKAEQANVIIRGTVFDSYSRQPMTGAAVTLTDKSAWAITDANGNFSIRVNADFPLTLEVTFLGYVDQTVTVENADKPLLIYLEEDREQIDEVLVVGYTRTTKNALTSATSTVRSGDIENIHSVDINDKIQGAVPGLLISNNSGIPGSSAMVRLRGATSISASNTPIYIVDGVFVSTGNPGQTDLGGLAIDPISDINPDDILSITVLKDASATASYGARGANGVIIINTKRGEASPKTRINFKAQLGVQQADNIWELVTGPEHAEIVNQAWINDGKDPSLRPFRPASQAITGYPAYGSPEEQITVDRLSDIFRTALQQTYNLSASGGNEKTTFYIGGEYTDEESTLKLLDFKRGSLRFNLDHNIRTNLKLSSSNAVVYTSRNLMRLGDGPAGLFQAALHTPTFQPVFNKDGSYNKPTSFDNHQAILDNWDGGSTNFRVTNSLSLNWDISDELSLKASANNDRTYYHEIFYYNTNLIYGQPNGTGVEGYNISNIFSTEGLLNYMHTFAGVLNFAGFFGLSYQRTQTDFAYMNGEGYPSNQLKRITSSAVQTASASGTSSALASIFGGVNLMYDNRYSIDFTLRADGSSRVGRNNRFGYFPAVGVSWNIMNEKFFPTNDYVNSLRLKASIGLGGNENIGDFASLALWEGGANYDGRAGMAPAQLGNPNLRWETTRQWNVGLTTSLFKQRLDLEFNYYDKFTYDLLLPKAVPGKTGFSSIVDNSGEISNKGIELVISSLNVSRSKFNWRTTFTLAHNKNRIEKLTTDVSGNYTPFKLFEGYPLYSMWVYEYLGVNPETGDAIYADHKKDGMITVDDKVVVGDAWPTIEGTLRNDFNWGPVNLDVNFYYKVGNKVFNYTRMFLESGGTRGITRSMQASSVNYWKNPGDTGVLPRPKSTANPDGSFNYEGQSSRVVEDGSFLRLKSITLSYTIPSRWVAKMGMEKVTLNASASNLFLLTKYTGPDPEVNVSRGGTDGLVQGMDFGMPPLPRSYTLGINLTL